MSYAPQEAAERDGFASEGERRLIRFDLLRFPLILLVIYIHASGDQVFVGNAILSTHAYWVSAIKFLVSNLIAAVAVPGLFFTSGYLFYRGWRFSWAGYARKLRSRFWTLFVPLVLWNLLVFLGIAMGQQAPVASQFFNAANERLVQLPIWQVVDLVIGITRSPIAYQFWFIRDLIVLAIATPLLWVAARFVPIPACATLMGLWVAGLWPFAIPEISAITFYLIGASLAVHDRSPFLLDRHRYWVYAGYAAMLVVMSVVSEQMFATLRGPFLVFAVASTLCLTRWAAARERLRTLLLALAPASFFVFAMHEPTQLIVRKLLYRLLPVVPEVSLLIFLFVPLLIAGLGVALFNVMTRILPRTTSLITGGRG